jgi:predicted ATPase
MLDSEVLRKASPPNQGKTLKANGGNLPWVLEDLKKNHAKLFKRWLAHIRTSLPDVKDLKIIRREDDAHKYFKIVYENGAEVPSWLVSDGTLRMLALTLLAYLPDFKGIYLIEEPENGIHPKAMETIFQSLSSVYEAQVLVASHSTAFLSVAEPQQLLCFAKDEAGEAHIIKGNEHPRLQQWKGETNLSILFAGGVLE